MIADQRVLAIVPARGGSKGLAGKNLADFHGMPLIGWPIKAALGSHFVDTVIVSTDAADIAEAARELGAEVPFSRPAELATDTATSAQVVVHAVEFFRSNSADFGYVVLLQPTSPLTETGDIDAALEMLVENRAIADAIVGVTRIEAAHPALAFDRDDGGLVTPHFADDFSTPVRRQDMAELFAASGNLYIADTEAFLREGGFYHSRTLGFVVPKWKAVDIDDIVDLAVARAIMDNVDELRGKYPGPGST